MTSTYPSDLNLGPLTTPFPAPTGCAKITISPVFIGVQTSSIYYYSAVIYTAPSCYPPRKPLGPTYTLSTLASYAYHDEHIFYSPGLCPSDWTSQSVSTALLSPTIPGAVGPVTETNAFCCPPGFNAWKQVHETGSTSDFFWRCDSSVLSPSTVVSGTLTVVFGTTSLRADPVFIKYREGDFPSSTTVDANLCRAGGRAGNCTSTLNQTSSLRPTSGGGKADGSSLGLNGGLSMGAKIGLGVGISVIFLFVGIFFAWIFMRRRKMRGVSPSDAHVQGGPHDLPEYKAELDGASGENMNAVVMASAAELEAGHESKDTIPPSKLELYTSVISPLRKPVATGFSSTDTQRKQENTTPLMKTPEFESSTHLVRSAEEEELEYQERRLRERREMLAERENIAREEDELRR